MEKEQKVKLTISEPIVVAQAPVELHRGARAWGRWQFPTIERMLDGRLNVGIHLEADAAGTYGKPWAHVYSEDDGKTWRMGEPNPEVELEGVLLPNGDRLKPIQLESIKGEEVSLPTPLGTYLTTYGTTFSLYLEQDFPDKFVGRHFRRLPSGKDDWVEERATVNIPGAIRGVSEGELSFPTLMKHWGQMSTASDGSLLGVNSGRRMIKGKSEFSQSKLPTYHPVFIISTDNGYTWNMLSEIIYKGDKAADPQWNKREGFSEPYFNFMPDGSVICLMRTQDGNGPGPSYFSRSTNRGKTWSEAEVFDDLGKLPKLLTLNNGVTLASYGGPGVFVRATADLSGQEWGKRVKVELAEGDKDSFDTCSYTEMVALDDSNALLVYSDFNYPDENGVKRKTILVRKVSTETEG